METAEVTAPQTTISKDGHDEDAPEGPVLARRRLAERARHADAGHELIAEVDRARRPPPSPARHPSSCPSEEARVEVMLDALGPKPYVKANADWYRLSVVGGLFSETDRRLLLTLQPDENRLARWHCVELRSEWDSMDKCAAGRGRLDARAGQAGGQADSPP